MTLFTKDLPTGTLHLNTDCDAIIVQDYLGFGARANPKRSFLFVSKVLGKHWPASPSKMYATHQLLAQKIQHIETPALFIGMAETAVGLGQGVFESWLKLNNANAIPNQGLFVQTTRYKVADTDYLIFDEAHSHAPAQYLHLPKDSGLHALFKNAKTLVLIDDEISTGNTFINLAAVCDNFCDELKSIHLVSLTDFSGDLRNSLPDKFSKPLSNHSLIQGEWNFSSNGKTPELPQLAQLDFDKTQYSPNDGFGRCGISQPITIADTTIRLIMAQIQQSLFQNKTNQTTINILILGTGEFMHVAFLLGLQLENALAIEGFDHNTIQIKIQSTSRSPILIWGDIGHKRTFFDNYGENIANYLYNVADAQYDHIYICHETPLTTPLQNLAIELNATLLFFKHGPNSPAIIHKEYE